MGYPTSLDNLQNPVAGVTYEDDATLNHVSQHANANNAIDALEAKVGIDGSSDTSSLDYKVAHINLASMYPIGSIYINAAVSTNPATLLGFGTWSLAGQGNVLVGYKSGDTDFGTLGATPGAKTVNLQHDHYIGVSVAGVGDHAHGLGGHTHGFNTNNNGTHTHNVGGVTGTAEDAGSDNVWHSTYGPPGHRHGFSVTSDGAGDHYHSGGTGGPSGGSDNAGGHSHSASGNSDSQLSTTQSIIQPSLVVYMWQRTA